MDTQREISDNTNNAHFKYNSDQMSMFTIMHSFSDSIGIGNTCIDISKLFVCMWNDHRNRNLLIFSSLLLVH